MTKPEHTYGLSLLLTVGAGILILCAGLSPFLFLVVAILIGVVGGLKFVKDI